MARQAAARGVTGSLIAGVCALGCLLGTSAAGGQGTSGVALTRVSGVVFDSLAMRPLVGALVQLVEAERVSASRSTYSGSQGAYAFDSLSAGTYLIGFFHPTLDSMGVSSPVMQLQVTDPGEMRVPLALPSATSFVRRSCGGTEAHDSTGLYFGTVRDAYGGAGRDAELMVEWLDIIIDGRGITHARPSLRATTGAGGAFAICGVPSDGTVTVRAWAGADSSGLVELTIPPHGMLRRDLYIGRSANVPLPADSALLEPAGSTAGADSASTGAVVRGSVRMSSGEPIGGARVVLWGSGVQGVSDADGIFRLRNLPWGTHTIEARALGFLPQRRAVDILQGPAALDPIELSKAGSALDTVRITATRLYVSPDRAAFERRKRMGFGYILDEDKIEQRNAIFMGDLFRMAPGVTVARGPGFGDRVLMRGSGFSGTYCTPDVFLDGMRVLNIDGDLDQLITPNDVRALEVYSRSSSIPAEFQTMNGCGTIVIWSGARRSSR